MKINKRNKKMMEEIKSLKKQLKFEEKQNEEIYQMYEEAEEKLLHIGEQKTLFLAKNGQIYLPARRLTEPNLWVNQTNIRKFLRFYQRRCKNVHKKN